ncbi:putative L-lactate dehydrogenase operon regulatory protein [Nymphon striatum]|nr:putative L-lactate dehydrogenase operon regulatory protein [Nymphon striatum]
MKRTRLSDQVAEELEKYIAEGELKPGDRLPAERTLAERLGVSRPSLREAIQKLASKNIVRTKAGGGTFISNAVEPSFVDPLLDILKKNPESRFDVLEARHAIEATAAWYAALRATNEDKEHIRKCFENMLNKHGNSDPMEEAKADAEFHLSIVKASHNPVLLHVMRGLFTLLQSSISNNLDKLYTIPKIFTPLTHQHEDLMNMVIAGKPEKARLAAQNHLIFVEDSLHDIDKDLAPIQLIQREEINVIFPQDQTCCGQPSWNSGYRDEARKVALQQVKLFSKDIPIVVPSGSCAGMMKHHYPELFKDTEHESLALSVSSRVWELTEFLVDVLDIQLKDLGNPVEVAVHTSCSARREMGVADKIEGLLQQLDNVTVLEQHHKAECCGFGGTFAVKQAEISAAMVEDKTAAIRDTGASVLVSQDCGCLLNISGSFDHQTPLAKPDSQHIATFLWSRTEQRMGDQK